MQKVVIRKRVVDGVSCYYVQALSLKNSENKISLLIPHPQGNERLEYKTLEEAVAAVKKSGFEYELPENESVSADLVKDLTRTSKTDLQNILFSKLKSKTNDINSSVSASALKALSYLQDADAIDIFLSKIGEDNDKIREIAIEALVSYGEIVIEKLISALEDTNWVMRNSAITALTKMSELTDADKQKILTHIIKRIDDKNTIVQSNALIASGQIYRMMICSQDKK